MFHLRNRLPVTTLATVLAVLAVGSAGCNDSSTNSAQTGYVRIRMTDAPADYDAVNVVVTQVSLHRSDAADSTSGWEIIRSDSTTYDLLQLQNGVFATIAGADVPAGTYTQLRLKLGAGSTVVVGGVAFPLVVPSGQQSGLKLNGPFEVAAGGTSDIALDFDAARSIHLTGNGTYKLTPVIRVVAATTSTGSIHGQVSPGGVLTSVAALSAGDTVQTTTTMADGQFTLSLLSPGTYTVAFDPAVGYRDTSLANVSVAVGATTDVGTIVLPY